MPHSFWSKVEKTKTCWLWRGYIGKNRYGSFHTVVRGKTMKVLAHRYAFMQYNILPMWKQKGLELDHVCRNRECVNPAHLELVTRRENLSRSPISITMVNARKTHCAHGHKYSAWNTIIDNGYRRCRTCRIACDKKRWMRSGDRHRQAVIYS